MDGKKQFRTWGNGSGNFMWINLKCVRVTVDKNGQRITVGDHIERGHERVRRQNHLIAGTNA